MTRCIDARRQVDVGNRRIRLALDSRVPKSDQEEFTRRWVDALTNQQVLGEVQGEAITHKAKFWKKGA